MIKSSFHHQDMQCTPFPSCVLDHFLRSKNQVSLHLPPQEETLNSAVAAGSEALSGALETVNRLLNPILSPACSADYNQFTSDLQNMSLTNPRTRYAIQSKSCCPQIFKSVLRKINGKLVFRDLIRTKGWTHVIEFFSPPLSATTRSENNQLHIL